MQQPPGFVNLDLPQHVCKLKKSIYGLKQAPRAWFSKLTDRLLHFGFIGSKSDSSLFIFRNNSDCVYVLIYVDDIVVTGSNPALITQFINALRSHFPVKDLGSLHYFLGIEVLNTDSGIFLSQNKCV